MIPEIFTRPPVATFLKFRMSVVITNNENMKTLCTVIIFKCTVEVLKYDNSTLNYVIVIFFLNL